MHRRIDLTALAHAGLTALACHNPVAVRPGSEAIRTDRQQYVANRAGGGVALDIPFRFTNPTDGPVNVPTCWGVHPPRLEKRVGAVWTNAYVPIVLLCLGPPVVVPRGGSYDYTLEIRTAPRGSNAYPQFELADVPGTYRLVWGVFYGDGSDYLTNSDQGPPPLAQRVSNTFRISE